MLTGSEGYLGCLLAPELVRHGHAVVGVATGFYRAGWLYRAVFWLCACARHAGTNGTRHQRQRGAVCR